MDEYLEAYSGRGYDRFFLGEYQGSLEDFSKAIELDPNNATNYRKRGAVFYSMQNYKDAKTDFQEAVRLDPGDVYALVGLASTIDVLGGESSYEDAVSLLDKAIELAPECTMAYLDRGFKRFKMKNYHGAEEDFGEAIRLGYDSSPYCPYYYRGCSRQLLGNYRGAEEDFSEAIRLGCDHFDVFFRRGTTRLKLERHFGARKDLQKAIQLSPTDASNDFLRYCMYMDLTSIAGKMEDSRDAIHWLNKAICVCPDEAVHYRLRGLHLSSLGSETGDKRYNSDAANDFTKAIELEPDYAAAYKHRADEWEVLGLYEKAIADLHHFKMLERIENPHCPSGYR